MNKLKSYGVDGRVTRWVKEVLSQRRMRVGVQGHFSEWVDVLSCVPQCSVFCPLHFLIFVNDLPNWVSNSMRMFARISVEDFKWWGIV